WMLSSRLLLAHRAEEGRAAVLGEAPDATGAAAGRTSLALAVVDPEIVLEHAELAVGALVVAQRRAASRDRVVERRFDGVDQRRGALVRRTVAQRQRRSLTARRQPGAVERLADIDIAEPGDHALVEQRRFQTRVLAAAGLRQHRGVERVAERLGAERAQQR